MWTWTYNYIPEWFNNERDPLWFWRGQTWGNVLAFAAADCAWRLFKLRSTTDHFKRVRFPGWRLNTPGALLRESLVRALLLVALRESTLNPLVLRYLDPNEERRRIHRLERDLVEGGSEVRLASITTPMLRATSKWDHVPQSAALAALIHADHITLSPSPLRFLVASLFIFGGTQALYNKSFAHLHQFDNKVHRSRELTTDTLRALFLRPDGKKRPINEVIKELELERKEDELVQVQKELAIVRRALSASGLNK